jgi:hypothetical protein
LSVCFALPFPFSSFSSSSFFRFFSSQQYKSEIDSLLGAVVACTQELKTIASKNPLNKIISRMSLSCRVVLLSLCSVLVLFVPLVAWLSVLYSSLCLPSYLPSLLSSSLLFSTHTATGAELEVSQDSIYWNREQRNFQYIEKKLMQVSVKNLKNDMYDEIDAMEKMIKTKVDIKISDALKRLLSTRVNESTAKL